MVKCNAKDSESSCRSFKIVGSGIGYVSPPTSYYKGKNAMAAAKKFGSMLFRLTSSNDPKYKKFGAQQTIKVILRETTRGSPHKTSYYKLERIALPKPIERVINGVTIINKYTVKASLCHGNDDTEIASMMNKLEIVKDVKKTLKKKISKKQVVTEDMKVMTAPN
jgi:hypothetical protein